MATNSRPKTNYGSKKQLLAAKETRAASSFTKASPPSAGAIRVKNLAELLAVLNNHNNNNANTGVNPKIEIVVEAHILNIDTTIKIPDYKTVIMSGAMQSTGARQFSLARKDTQGGDLITLGAYSKLKLVGLDVVGRETASPAHSKSLIAMTQPRSTLILEGSLLRHNDNHQCSGGAIRMTGADSTIIIDDKSVIANNSVRKAGQKGGGIYASTGKIILKDGDIRDNAAPIGGGVYITGSAVFVEAEAASIANNVASYAYGGGIAGIDLTSKDAITVNGEMIGNKAETVGGGIYVDRSDLSKVIVSNTAEFTKNSDITGAPINKHAPKDDKMYNSLVKSGAWTVPFTQGYNNFDIAYSFGGGGGGGGNGGGPGGFMHNRNNSNVCWPSSCQPAAPAQPAAVCAVNTAKPAPSVCHVVSVCVSGANIAANNVN